MTPATNPKAPNIRGKGASGRLPVTSRIPSIMIVPAPPQAAAQVNPIPMAPRMRLNHCFMPASHASGGPASPPASHQYSYSRATLQGKVPVRILTGKKASDEALSHAEFAAPARTEGEISTWGLNRPAPARVPSRSETARPPSPVLSAARSGLGRGDPWRGSCPRRGAAGIPEAPPPAGRCRPGRSG